MFFKTDTTISTIVAGLFIPLRDGDEGSWNNKSNLSEECFILVLFQSLNPTSPSVQSRRSFQDISSHKSIGEVSVLTSAGQSL